MTILPMEVILLVPPKMRKGSSGKTTKLIVRNGEYFYKRKGGREVSILSYN